MLLKNKFYNKSMKKILLSLSMLALVGVIAAGATTAFFTDTETSTGNTFTAGSIDLKIDSTAHYNGMICVANNSDEYSWQYEGKGPFETDPYQFPAEGASCDNSWTETDLGAGQKFFQYTDLKPGDFGENTISLHVYDNDAWGRIIIKNVVANGNTCTEPETETAADADCIGKTPGDTEADGELDNTLLSSAWIDDGSIAGFQNNTSIDSEEGDNIKNGNEIFITQSVIGSSPNTINMWDALSAYRAILDTDNVCNNTDSDGDGQTGIKGDTSTYKICQGIAEDGRLVGSTTYYVGVDWSLPAQTGNEVQSDTLQADLEFNVVQRRNNPGKTF